jgi:hypothetical protein
MKKLEELKLIPIGFWEIREDKLEYTVENEKHLNTPNTLYAFVVNEPQNDYIAYIGKTTQTLGSRFYGYCRGNGKSTNNKVHHKIKEQLNLNNNVNIWALLDDSPLSWGIYNINLAAGLEDALISKIKPIWNGSKTSSETLEEDTLLKDNDDIYPLEEQTKLQNAYYNKGYVNISTKNSPFLGKHGEAIFIFLGANKEPILSKIDRNATRNGSVRISTNLRPIRDYYQLKYYIGDFALIRIIGRNQIQII